MTQLHRILAATDLSASARHAVYRAAKLAKAHQAELTVQHIIDHQALAILESMLESIHKHQVDDLIGNAQRQVEALISVIQEKFGITANSRLDTGKVIRALMGAVADLNPDLVVLGARGIGFVRHMLLGSTPERLLTRIRQPILVARQTPRDSYQKILVPVDFSHRSLPALQFAHALAPHAKITALHVYQPPFEPRLHTVGLSSDVLAFIQSKFQDEATRQMQALIAACHTLELAVEGKLESGEPSHCILEYEQEQGYDLIVLSRYGHAPFGDLAVGSISRHVLTHSQNDVLISAHVEQHDA